MPETPPHSENDSTRERFSLDRLPLPEPVRDWLRKRSRRWLWIVPAALSGAVAVAAVVMAIDYINKPKYTRSECMIRMDVYHGDSASELDICSEKKIINNFIIKYKIKNNLPLSGHGFNSYSDPEFYFQFFDDCAIFKTRPHDLVAACTLALLPIRDTLYPKASAISSPP